MIILKKAKQQPLNMINKILFFLLISASKLFSQTTVLGVDTIWKGGNIDKRINLVFLGDGYTASEQAQFITDVTDVTTYMFNEPPFSNYKNYFNVIAIKCESPQSGVTHPGTATDVTEPASPVISVTNCFNTKFDNYAIHRLIYSMNASAIYSVMAQYFPNYDQIVVLGNSPVYGGAGGAYAVSSTHTNSKEIVLHEMGHSFAGLADEYWAGPSYAAEKPNMTQDNSAGNKWGLWQGLNGIGAYAYGTASPDNTWFRPHQNCRMRYLNKPFCSVCKETIIEKIHELTSPIDSYSPDNSSPLTFTAASMWFKANTIKPFSNTLKSDWFLNSNIISHNSDSVEVLNSMLVNGYNNLTFMVTDTTSLSKDLTVHPGFHTFLMVWDINYSVNGTKEITPKLEYSIFPNPATQIVNIKYQVLKPVTISFMLKDNTGKTVLQTKAQSVKEGEYKTELHIENLPSGMYFLTLELDNQVFNNKFVVSK